MIRVIGAGLAGCEAALSLANFGFKVSLIEMKPVKKTPAQKLNGPCELVCSNSFRSTKKGNAVALLKDEMALANGALISLAFKAMVPAGDCLAVDRVLFSALVEEKIAAHKNITRYNEEVLSLPHDDIPTILATGPLTSDALATSIQEFLGQDRLYFYDAIAPIIDADSIDQRESFLASRWHEDEEGDYLNCPLDKQSYEAFVSAVLQAAKATAHDFEDVHYFEGCLPIEVLAERGLDTLRFGPMKPTGLVDPKSGKRPHAVLQLRKEDKYGLSYNIVGCQTRMTISEQKAAFGLIPALKNATFMRYGAVHRNTYINSPDVLDDFLCLKDKNGKASQIFVAGQLSGVEGYVESMAMGLLVAHIVKHKLTYNELLQFPAESALGGLYGHVRGLHRASKKFQYSPSNITWAMLPPLDDHIKNRKDKREMLHERGLLRLKEFMANYANAHSRSSTEACAHT
jgi:methylenetetrahydrofolate--tRNA-(uracil-5-)-methyltransferase